MKGEGRAGAAASIAAGDDGAVAAMLADVEAGRAALEAADAVRIEAWLSHPDKALRRRAAGALAVSLASGVFAAAVAEVLLSHADPNVRWGAAYALARSGRRDGAVVDASLDALDDGDGDVRWAAASVVVAASREDVALRHRLGTLATTGSARMRKMAILCLADGGGVDGDLLAAALRDEEPFVRLAAITAVARGGDAGAAAIAALRLLADGDAEPRVRRAASAVLSRLGHSTTQGNRG